MRKHTEEQLAELGYRVVTAENGAAALAHVEEGCVPDILFTDLVMPGGINGWELAESARRISPELRVLLTSGYALEALAERGRLPEGGVVLNKPYRKAELAKRVREALTPAS